jgi:hypothetical protein
MGNGRRESQEEECCTRRGLASWHRATSGTRERCRSEDNVGESETLNINPMVERGVMD